ncbi:hypothetical protein BGX27_004114 [Mortierella sp. AM989]|nr:hypothetical protein BGX27_004114 [Mortierella sp. AM989]
MGSVGILLLRISILVLAIVSLVLSSLCFVHDTCYRRRYSYGYLRDDFELNTEWISPALAVIIILSYAFSLKGKPVVKRFVRAFYMFVLAGLVVFNALLYIEVRDSDDGFLLFTTGPFILVEMGWTLWKTRPNQPNEGQNCKQNPNIITVSPEIPNDDNISIPIQYVYPPPLPQPQAATPDACFIAADPLPPIQYVYPSPLPQPQTVTPDAYFIAADPLPPNVELKQNFNVITVSPEMPNGDNISIPPIQYVYPSSLPQPQAVTPDSNFITADPLSVNVKRSPQSQSEMAMVPSPQNREIPQQSHSTQSTALPSALTPQLLPQTAQFYGTPQLLPQAPQLYGTPQQGL